MAMLGAEGLTAIETSTGGEVSNVALPETAPKVAVTVAVPTACVVARPQVEAALDVVTIAVSDDDQVTELVRFWVLASV